MEKGLLMMRTTGLIAFGLVFALAVAAAGSASTKVDPLRMHFGGIPPKSVEASPFTTGKLLISLKPRANTTWNVYSGGWVVWQKWDSSGAPTVVPDGATRLDTSYVQQQLTPQGVQLLQAKLLATGLFEHNLRLDVGSYHAWFSHQVRRGDRLVTVSGAPSPGPPSNQRTKATPAQVQALTSIENFVADPSHWLPASAWADRRIQAIVPGSYLLVIDRGYPDLSKLPASARKALVQYKLLKSHACQIITIGQARTLVQTFVKAGIPLAYNSARTIAFDFAGLHFRHPSYLHLHPALPNDRC
jgi:hypothetical protein